MLLSYNNRNEIEIVKTYSVSNFKKTIGLSKIYIGNGIVCAIDINGYYLAIRMVFNNSTFGKSHIVISKIIFQNQVSYLIHSILDFTVNNCDFIEICKELNIDPFDRKYILGIDLNL